MVIEALSYKLCLDFFIYLNKNRIYSTDIKLDFYDRSKHEYVNFSDLDSIQTFFTDNYLPVETCSLGDLVTLQNFRSSSDVYSFPTTYIVTDIALPSYQLVQGSGFDLKRNDFRTPMKNRQKALLESALDEYRLFYNELKMIYHTGIYSPCYAEPGWSKNTWYLNSLKNALLDPFTSVSFPYKSKIDRFPPA